MRGILLAAALSVAAAALAEEKNLAPDPSFQEGEKTWLGYVIENPSTWTFNAAQGGEPASVTLTGGRTFLHSSRFAVTAGKTYRIAFKAKGDGKVSPGLLWWKPEFGMAEPHWTRPEQPLAAEAAWKDFTVEFPASPESTEVYVRFEVTAGSATISSVSVVEVPAPAGG